MLTFTNPRMHSGNRALRVDMVTTTSARTVGTLWGVGVVEPLSEAALAGAWERCISHRRRRRHPLSLRRPLSHLPARRQASTTNLRADHLQWAGHLIWTGHLQWACHLIWAANFKWVGLIQWAGRLQWAGLLEWAGYPLRVAHLQWVVVGSDMGNIHHSSTVSHLHLKAHHQICQPGGGFKLFFRLKCHNWFQKKS